MMKFSIILPVKNGGEYIKQCVQSILTQAYPDFNLHILENCSNDGTAEWLQTLTDERVIIIPSGRPLSIEENWARIVSINKNEFMTIIGHDDLLNIDYLKGMNELINQYPDASLYQTHFSFIDARGNFIRHCKPMDEKQTVAEFLNSLFTNSIDTMGSGYMMRSKNYNDIGGIPSYPNLLFADHVLWIRMTSLNYKATSTKENFAYRLHNNLSKKSGAVSYINAFYDYMDFLIAYKTNHHQSATVIKEYICPYILYYCRSLSHRLLKTPFKERNEITVSGFINNCIKYNGMLASTHTLNPLQQVNIRYAKFIDNNFILRRLYLLFKKFYNKPIYS